MKEKIRELTHNMKYNNGVLNKTIVDVQSKLNCNFPEGYVEFMENSNGAAGFIGGSYLLLWKIEEIIPLNNAAGVDEFVPGFILFGSDGGGEAYAFDTRDDITKLVQVPFVGMEYKEAIILGETFFDFLNYLKSK